MKSNEDVRVVTGEYCGQVGGQGLPVEWRSWQSAVREADGDLWKERDRLTLIHILVKF